MSCCGKISDGTQCKKEGPYCKSHEYMKDYTSEMIENCTFCKGCKKMKFTGDYALCDNCRTRSEINRKKAKSEIILCAKQDCKYKKSKENKYCGNHQLCLFLDATEELGLKCCKNVTRGCRSQLLKDAKLSCEPCLVKEREKDHAKRSVLVKTETEKQCSVCCKLFPLEYYKGLHGETRTCQECRECYKKADEKRDKEHVNELARKNEKKPERREVKQQWKEENYEKVALYDLNYKAKQIEMDMEGYLKKQAENAKKWRDKNPEKTQEINQRKINSIDAQLSVYKTSAHTKGLLFEIDDVFHTIVKSPCYYCGILQEKGFNGIDRLDSTKGYIKENVVTCCEMCNFMKGTESPNTFIHHVEHILTHQKIVEGRLFSEELKDTKHVLFSEYKKRAEKKKLEFTLTEEQFEQQKMEDCYLCGKKNTLTHKNGIDRFDNARGYIVENIKTCCGNCNYLKRDYSYDLFIEKCRIIYKNKPSEVIIEPIVRVNKTKEEITEEAKIRKQKSREKKKEALGDEEYRKMRAKEIAEGRKKRKESIA
jgi:hypothetical protein